MAGEYTELQEGEKITFKVQGRGEPAPSRVEVVIKPNGKGAVVTLTHSGIGTDATWGPAADHVKTGWEEGLENLQSVLETGWDLRFIRQPMMGVFVAGFIDDKQAQELGTPVNKGMRLSSTLPGLAAEQAGLTNQDVIYSLNGVVLDSGATYTATVATSAASPLSMAANDPAIFGSRISRKAQAA